jgi:ATP/maltotriose-dependent transcriptional regulator MalT
VSEPQTVRALLAAARPAAYARLLRATELPIAIVAAPAGYGGSTVVRDFLNAHSRPYRCAEIDSLDSGALGVLRALATAAGDIAPAFASSFVSVYDRLSSGPDAADGLAQWAAPFMEIVGGTIVIEGGFPAADITAADFLTKLIDHSIQTVRWIVVTPSSDPFPIARWLAEDRLLVPVDAADLAVTAAELRSAADRSFQRVPQRTLTRLCRRTAGWPAAVALGLAAGDSLDLRSAPAGGHALYAFLADAAVAALTERERTFVELTCLFARFDDTLIGCAGLDAAADVDVIARLTDDLSVLIRDGAGSYRYDRLFAAYYERQLRGRADGSFERIAAAAAAAYERDGRYAAAIALHLERRDNDAAGALIAAHGFALVERGESSAVQRALESIPHNKLLGHPGALAVKASLESLHGKFDVAEAWFRLALASVHDEAQRHEIAYRFAIDLVRRERADAIDVLLPIVNAIDQAAPLAAPLWALLATAYASHRRTADASLAIDRALRLLPHLTDPNARAKIVYQAGFVALARRDIAAAKSFARRAHREAAACFCYDVAARALSIAYNIAVDFDDDVGAGRAYLEQLAELSLRAGSRQLLLYATLCRYELETISGEVKEIARLERRLASLDVLFSVLATETLLPAQALQAAWAGNFARAYRLLEPSLPHQINADWRAHRSAEVAVYAAAAGLRAEAATAAEQALTLARTLDLNERTVAETLSYVALAYVLLRRRVQAAKLLDELALVQGGNQRGALFVRAVALLAARWTSAQTSSELATALEALEAHELGGLARLIEALPLPESARRNRRRGGWIGRRPNAMNSSNEAEAIGA